MTKAVSAYVIVGIIALGGGGLTALVLAQQPSLADAAKKAEEQRVKNDKGVTTEKADMPDEGDSSSTSQPVTCGALLQHPLAWWLGSMPTPAERNQLAACLAGSGQQIPTSPSVSPVASAIAQDKPANWNFMNAQQQAWWLCRDDPERVTASCKMVLKETAAQTAPPAPPVPSSATVARWTPDTCNAEHQSLSLLSERINQSIAQLQAVAALPPPGSTAKAPTTYRCNSDSLGSQTTTRCQPETGYLSPGAAASNAIEDFLAERAAAKRLDALAAHVQTQQSQFDARSQEWESHCTKR